MGANSCGRSTLLRGLARLLRPREGAVYLDGRSLTELRWTDRDEDAVARALAATGTTDLADRPLQQLSGGQRQRVWVAMALAQDTDLLLLDEPTTYLDINHQVELLRQLRQLNTRSGRTIVIVLHDLNLACRFCDPVIAMAEGSIVAEGAPAEVGTAELVEKVFGLACVVIPDPVAGTPMVVPA